MTFDMTKPDKPARGPKAAPKNEQRRPARASAEPSQQSKRAALQKLVHSASEQLRVRQTFRAAGVSALRAVASSRNEMTHKALLAMRALATDGIDTVDPIQQSFDFGEGEGGTK